jgi:putative PIG3 family NAD(P)H quinone oxidoreductase
MKAMVIVPKTAGEGSTLEWREVPDPQPQSGELLIRVKASAVNRADLYQRMGSYPTAVAGSANTLTIAGLECAGEVAGLSAGVSGFTVGDRVMSMCFGGYAEYAVVDHRIAVHVPERLSWQEAAAIPVSYMTEHDAIVTNARLQPGESVLINAASSGVGVAAIQVAKLFAAKPIIGVSGDASKLERLKAFGLDHGVNYREENFADSVLALTGGKGVDIVIDHVGASQFQDNVRCMALRGRLVSVGRLGGNNTEINLDFLALRRLQLIGVTFRTRTMEERAEIARRFIVDVLPALAGGRLRPVLDREFPLREALAAQEYLASNAQLGKVTLTV